MIQPADSIDDLEFKRVLGHFASGLTIVSVLNDGKPAGLTCQSFASVSLDPPIVAFFAQRDSLSWAAIRAEHKFCVNVLSTHQENLARVFATSGIDKFRGVSIDRSPGGLPIIEGCLAWIECSLRSILDAGDHEGALGDVQALGNLDNGLPLVFFRGQYGTFSP